MSKTCLVTGASRGIGAATVSRLSRTAPDIGRYILIARQSEEFDARVGALRQEHPDKDYVQIAADLAVADEVIRAIDQVHEAGIKIAILINNAGYTNPQSVAEIDLDEFRHTLEVNLIAPFLIVQRILNHGMRLETIVNIASTAGITGRPGWLTYSASKAAVINMSDVLREELKVFGTKVVCLSPGRCATDLRRRLAPDEDPDTIMQPDAVAGVVEVMLTEHGRHMAGANVVVRSEARV